jgi:hypothetical protein
MDDDPAGLNVIAKAPELVLPTIADEGETGRVLEVARVAYAPTPAGPDLVWLETTDGQLLRLPPGLHAWAHDTVAVVLGMGGNVEVRAFPMRIEFGILDGRPYAEML